jgi:hypothetical protein
VRRGVALGAAVLAVAGCGYEEDEPGAASPREAFELFVTAVKERDPGGEELVSRRLDRPGREAFLAAMTRRVAPLNGGYSIIVDEQVNERLAVVAAAGANGPPPGAFAAVLVRDGSTWFVEPPSLDLIYGTGAEFQVNTAAGGPRPEGRLWLDGEERPVRETAGALTHRFSARGRRPDAGRHSVVAFARVGRRVGAIAWTITAE